VYAPTTSVDKKDMEEFYRILQSVLNEIPRKDVVILMGDWNAKIGKGEESELVEKYGLGNRNEAGEWLLEFCEENALFLANTFFSQPERRLYTWTSPNGKYKNQIGYIIGRRRWRSTIQVVKTRLDANCGLDDELLTATVKIRLKNTQKTRKWTLDTDNITEYYKSDIQKKLTMLKLEGGNSENTWKVLKDTIIEAADKHIPKKRRKKGLPGYPKTH
jgi:hypothetical protein